MYSKMYSPDGKTTVEVLAHNVNTMKSRGWLVKKPAAKSVKSETKESK